MADVVADTVLTADLAAGRWLAAELDRQGDQVLWEGLLAVLRPLAARPFHGRSEQEGVEYLRRIARGPCDPVTACCLGLSAAYRELGEYAAHEVWERAPADLHRPVFLQKLVSYCTSIGTPEGERLRAAQAVALSRGVYRNGP
ncbi:hypothetical protein OHV05_34920 [Kitasatospora sp. NBC_00070]|uniref:hypothetical protein n=1 Tax=Kitasatospora sp. NBC_00070 TaxID=2975962 RepID=UPI00325065F4